MIRISKLLLLLFALVSVARADEWSKTFIITGKPALRVETSDANIRVDTWGQNTIEARVTSEHWKIGEGGVRVIERQMGDSVELEVRLPHEHHICIICVNVHSYRVIVAIHMPRERRVTLRTAEWT